MENPTNLVLQFVSKLQIKSKTVMSWNSREKKEGIFMPFILSK